MVKCYINGQIPINLDGVPFMNARCTSFQTDIKQCVLLTDCINKIEDKGSKEYYIIGGINPRDNNLMLSNIFDSKDQAQEELHKLKYTNGKLSKHFGNRVIYVRYMERDK